MRKFEAEDWKKIGRKLLFPPVWMILLLTVISTAALIGVFVNGWEESPAASIIYVLAFYSLTLICIAFGPGIPGHYRLAKRRISETKYGGRYMTDVAFKTHISLYLSLTVNLLYVGVNVFSFFFYRSAWFFILAGYYSILAIMRFLLLRYVGKHKIGGNQIAELRRSRLCAVILLTVNFVLPAVVLMILYQNKGFEYYGILIYVMAMYTFYMTVHAIVDIIKYRKYNSPVMTTAKVITLSAALVSMLSLETAMLSQFGGEMITGDKRILIAATGAGISVTVIAMSVYMIVRAVKEIEKLRSQNNGLSE